MPEPDAERLRSSLRQWLTKNKIRLNDRSAIKTALEMGDGSVHSLLTKSESISPELYIRTLYKITGRTSVGPVIEELFSKAGNGDGHNGHDDGHSHPLSFWREGNGEASKQEEVLPVSSDSASLHAQNLRLRKRIMELEGCLEEVERTIKCSTSPSLTRVPTAGS
ncbi:hypothetical protein BH09SUM1_BH09SUM1_34170 [soil metagenome]